MLDSLKKDVDANDQKNIESDWIDCYRAGLLTFELSVKKPISTVTTAAGYVHFVSQEEQEAKRHRFCTIL